MTKLPGYYTTAELAAETGLSQNTVRWHCSHGRLALAAVWTESQWLVDTVTAKAFITSYTARTAGANGGGRP